MQPFRTWPPKAVFFDLDGTLIDSSQDVLSSFGAAFQGLGEPVPPREDLLLQVGRNLEDCFRPFLGDDSARLSEAVRLFRRHYREHYADHTLPYPGIAKSVRELSARYRLGVATMKKGSFARDLVRALGWLGTFERVIGAEEGYPPKPDPTLLLALCRAFDLRPDEVVYVGDTSLDARMAKAARIPFFFASYGYGKLEEEDRGSIEGTIDTPQMLWRVLMTAWRAIQEK